MQAAFNKLGGTLDDLELLRAFSVLPEIGAAKSLNLIATRKKAASWFVKSKSSLTFALFCDFVAKFSRFIQI